MLQCHFVDGCFDPAHQQFLRLHERTDDFKTTMGKARQYMDAQEQVKISAVAKKPNVCFAASEPEPNQIQPILNGLQKVLQIVLENQNQNQKPDVKAGSASNSGNGNGSKKKGSKPPNSASSDCSNSTQGSDRRTGNGNQGHQNASARGSGPPCQS